MSNSGVSNIEPVNEQLLATYTKQVYANTPYRDELLDETGAPVALEHVVYVVSDGGTGPNHLQLARTFVLFDHFQAWGDPSSALTSDFIIKTGRRTEGEPTAVPPAGYLWSNAVSAGLSVRNYGWPAQRDPVLRPLTVPDLGAALATPLPKLTLIRLPAGSDAALGQIVSTISKSPDWANTAIFIHEPTAAYVISPFSRLGLNESGVYGTPSLLRTIELILGLKPMSHFDAAAKPLWNAFLPMPNIQPYTAAKP